MMGADFTVIIIEDSPRAADFMRVFGRLEVHVKSFIPQLMELPNFYEPQPCYLLDFDFVSEEEFNRLAILMSEKFNANLDAVTKALRATEMPILAADCMVMVENPLRWLDFDEDATEEFYAEMYDYEDEDDFED
jgi:hypothetical protein